MIKVMEKFLYEEQLNNVDSVLGADESNLWSRSINMSNKEKLNMGRLFIVTLHTDPRHQTTQVG